MTATDLGRGDGFAEVHGQCRRRSRRASVNISTRMQVGTGDNALIAGFIMRGSAPKRLAIRGHRTVAVALPAAVADPVLELHDSIGATIATNDNWGDAPNKQDVIDVGSRPVRLTSR